MTTTSYIKFIVLTSFLLQHDAVVITPGKSPVLVPDTDTFVVLPCNFSTTDYPQITWYRHTDGKRNLVVQRNMAGRHQVAREYRGRVGFGNRGDLILIKPKADDSGHFSCEVEVDYDNPVWAKVEMDLQVLHEEKDNTTTMAPSTLTTVLPSAEAKGSSGKHGFKCLMFLDWFLPIAFTFILTGGQGKLEKNTWDKVRQSRRRMAATFVVVALINPGMVMVFASILLLADSICTVENMTPHGSLLLVAIAVLHGLKKKILCQSTSMSKREAESAEKGKEDEYENVEDRFEEGNESSPLQTRGEVGCKTENKRNAGGHPDALLSPSSYQAKYKEQPKFKTIEKPSDENVIGMTSSTYNDLYACTKSKLFYMYAKERDKEYETLCTSEENDYLTLANSKTGVIVTKRNRKAVGHKETKLHFIQDKGKKLKFSVSVDPVHPCVCVDSDGKHMYITDFEGGRLVSTDAKGNRRSSFGAGVLKNPVCVVENRTGQLIVVDSWKSDLFVFEKTGNFVTGVKISMPRNQEILLKRCDKMAMGEDGRIFVAGPFSNNIVVFSPDFRFERAIQAGTETSGRIFSLMVVKDSLCVAHEDYIRIYPLSYWGHLTGMEGLLGLIDLLCFMLIGVRKNVNLCEHVEVKESGP